MLYNNEVKYTKIGSVVAFTEELAFVVTENCTDTVEQYIIKRIQFNREIENLHQNVPH